MGHCSSLICGSTLYAVLHVTRCTLSIVLYLDHMSQCGLHAVLWSNIRTLNYALPCIRTSPYHKTFIPLSSYWPCIRWCGTAWFQEQGQSLFNGLSCSILTIVFYYFSLSLHSVYIGWYCEAEVFGLIWDHYLWFLHCLPLLIIKRKIPGILNFLW